MEFSSVIVRSQALEVVHAQRRCMQGLTDEYRRRLDLLLRGIETRLGQELVLEPQRAAAPVALDGEARALALARGLEQRYALEERAVVAGPLQADVGHAFGKVGRCHAVPAAAGFTALPPVAGPLAPVALGSA